MSLSEFSLISRYFTRRINRPDVLLGIGDDCALLNLPAGMALAVSMDTLVAGVHFPHHTSPQDIGYKLMAVNLSDLAAMGAQPAWITLALTLPESDEVWLDAFCRGLFELADRYQMSLIGGDTTHGPLTLTLQVHGFVPTGQALRRDGARPGDLIYVTGTLGDGGLGLRCAQSSITLVEDHRQYAISRLNRPTPRIEAGLILRGLASSAIDVSDGLLADLDHILTASCVGAVLELSKLPLSPAYLAAYDHIGGIEMALSAGDDYELCFTVSPGNVAQVEAALGHLGCGFSCIGQIRSEAGLSCRRADASEYVPVTKGYDHFAPPALRS